jgi:hypothetical protein
MEPSPDAQSKTKPFKIPGFLAANMSSADLIKIFQDREKLRK